MQIQHFHIGDDGKFPNNMALPVLVYHKVLELSTIFPALKIMRLFKKHDWYNAWKNGIYSYQHYHSNTHEVLGFYKGQTVLQLGGPSGITLVVEAGDVLIIPAGVAHKNLQPEKEIKCVGAYPDGRDYDIKRGSKGERPTADKNIINVPLPQMDPVFGLNGTLRKYWK